MQIYLKPSYRKMIMRAARPYGNTIVSGGKINQSAYDVCSNGPEHSGTIRYHIKNFAINGYSLYSTINIDEEKIHRI